MKDRYINVDGLHVHYREEGKGKPILLIHGWGKTWPNDPHLKILSEKFRVIIPDLPGYGGTQPLTSTHTIENTADFLAKVLEKLKLKDAVLIGGSMGTLVCAALAHKNPNLINRCVLIGALSHFPKDVSKRYLYPARFFTALFKSPTPFFRPLFRTLIAPLVALVLNPPTNRREIFTFLRNIKELNRHHPLTLLENCADFVQKRFDRYFRSLKRPLFIYGEKDRFTRQKKRVSSLPKKARLVLIPGAKHGINPEASASLYQKILKNIGD